MLEEFRLLLCQMSKYRCEQNSKLISNKIKWKGKSRWVFNIALYRFFFNHFHYSFYFFLLSLVCMLLTRLKKKNYKSITILLMIPNLLECIENLTIILYICVVCCMLRVVCVFFCFIHVCECDHIKYLNIY